MPNRPHPEVVAKPIPEGSRVPESRRSQSAPLPKHPHRPGILARVGLLLLFLIASGALVFGVLTFLKSQQEKDSRSQDIRPPANASETGKTPAAADSTRAAEPQKTPPLPPPSAPSEPIVVDPPPPLPEGLNAKPLGEDERAVLGKFLSARTLEERLPVIETKTPQAELAGTCLAAPLPPAADYALDYQETDSMEDKIDFFYYVSFQKEQGPPEKFTILVRTRGKSQPKVVVDPFLDTFGGRLAAYASKPTDKAGVFQVIADPIATCLDPKVPDKEKKLTLKLLPCENTKEIALAFFGRQSKIGQMLEDGTHSLSYGKPKPCTIMLSWNMKDDPNHPFIEAVHLKALDWTP